MRDGFEVIDANRHVLEPPICSPTICLRDFVIDYASKGRINRAAVSGRNTLLSPLIIRTAIVSCEFPDRTVGDLTKDDHLPTKSAPENSMEQSKAPEWTGGLRR